MESSDPYDFAGAESGGCGGTTGVKDHKHTLWNCDFSFNLPNVSL